MEPRDYKPEDFEPDDRNQAYSRWAKLAALAGAVVALVHLVRGCGGLA